MAGRKIDGVAVAAIGAGTIFLYAGIKGKTILGSAQAVIAGKAPSTSASANPITGSGDINLTAVNSPAGVGPAAGGIYTSGQLQSLWQLAGGNPSAAAAAACIAMAESGGNPRVTSGNPDGGTNVGLWQLDTPGGKGAGYSIAQLQDPMTNARVAIAGSRNGADWTAWATRSACGV